MLTMLKAIRLSLYKTFCLLPVHFFTFKVHMVSPDVEGTLGFCGQEVKKAFLHSSGFSQHVHSVFYLIFGVNAKFKTGFAVIGSTVCLGIFFNPKMCKKFNWCNS